MTASRRLAELRRIDEATCVEIDKVHEQIDACMHAALDDGDEDRWAEWVLTEYDKKLQRLWDFPQDESKHTLFKKYLFKKQWYGKTYKCVKTGEEFTIPFDVSECDFYSVGQGYVDVGRYNSYCRFSGVTEVKDES